jgi:signal peptidase I
VNRRVRGAGVAVGTTVREVKLFYAHKRFIQGSAASCGDREKALRKAGFSPRTGFCDFGSVVRQDVSDTVRLQHEPERIMNLCPDAAMGEAHLLKCELASEVLHSSGRLRLCVTGWSMLPTVWPGDTLVVERVSPDQVRIGDVVVVARDGKLCEHRVISITEDSGNRQWITRGDALPVPDRPVLENELLGRASYLIRAGKRLAMPAELNLVEQLIAKIVQNSGRAARALVYLHRKVHIPEKSAPEESVPCQG